MFYINPETLFTGQNVVYLPTCRSTNDYASKLLGDHILDGTVVITSEQTAGRGQRGNVWETKPNLNLTFTVIWKLPFLPPHKQFYLNMAVSLSILDFLSEYLLKDQVFVKWPNDIYIKNKKLGGILIENQLQSQQIKYAMIGIGLNINQIHFQESKAISLAQITQKEYKLNGLLEQLFVKLEKRYFELRSEKYNLLKMNYLKKMYRYQELHFFRDKNETFQAQIVGIDATGKLAVARQNQINYYAFQEIQFL